MRGIFPPVGALRVVLTALVLGCVPLVSAFSAPPAVEKVRVQTHDGFTRVVLETNAPIEPNLFTLRGPDRLVIDLPELQWRIPKPSGAVDSPLVRRFKFGLFQPGVSRLVLSLSGPTQVLNRKRERTQRGFLYKIDLATVTSQAGIVEPRREPAVSPAKATKVSLDDLPTAATVDPATKSVFADRSFDPEKAEFEALGDIISAALNSPRSDDSETEEGVSETRTAALTPDLAPLREDSAPTSPDTADELAIDLDLPKRPPLRIVLDPGHGGKDPGTGSNSGVYEKDINLAFAKSLAKMLEADPRYEVFLTRDSDVRVKLPKRVLFARRKNADLFISIHADWSDNKHAKGATAYTLSEEASVEALDNIATERDKVGRVAGVDLAAEREDVARLLVDLARRETQARSLKFAELVVGEVAKETPVLRRPLRRDSFHVLKAPDMPSVLLELGFLSNEEDRKLLQSSLWRLKTAEAVKRAIDSWRKATGARDFANR